MSCHIDSVFILSFTCWVRISSDKASNLPKRDVRLFVEITTGETRHNQQIYIDEPSMHHCSQICIFKTGFL